MLRAAIVPLTVSAGGVAALQLAVSAGASSTVAISLVLIVTFALLSSGVWAVIKILRS